MARYYFGGMCKMSLRPPYVRYCRNTQNVGWLMFLCDTDQSLCHVKRTGSTSMNVVLQLQAVN